MEDKDIAQGTFLGTDTIFVLTEHTINNSHLTSSSSATRDSRRAVGKTRGVKLTLIVAAARGAGNCSSFKFCENMLPMKREHWK